MSKKRINFVENNLIRPFINMQISNSIIFFSCLYQVLALLRSHNDDEFKFDRSIRYAKRCLKKVFYKNPANINYLYYVCREK